MSQGFRYQASWGGVLLDVTNCSVNHGRNNPRHQLPRRPGALLEEDAREPWVCSLDFVFTDRDPHPGESQPVKSYLDRFEKLNELVDLGGTRTLVHPYVGAVRCKIDGFSHRASGEVVGIDCSATFTEDSEADLVFAPDTIRPLAGSQTVKASSGAARTALADAGVDEWPVLEEIDDAVGSWAADPELTSRQVYLEMAKLRGRLSDALDETNATSDIDRYPIVREAYRLQHELVRAAEAFTGPQRRVVSLEVTAALPLRIIAARFYGADQAEQRFAEMRELNPSLRNPARVEPGTMLRAYSPRLSRV